MGRMKKTNRRLSRISTIEELRHERTRIGMQIELKEFELEQDWEYVKGVFSLEHMLHSLLGELTFSSVWDGIVSGISTVRSLLGGCRKKKKRKELCR